MLRIRVILYGSGSRIWTKCVPDPVTGRTLIRIRRIQAKSIRIHKQAKRMKFQECLKSLTINAHISCIKSCTVLRSMNWNFLQIIMQMSLKKESSVLSWDLFSLFNGFVESGSASFDTDPAQLLIRIRIRNTAVDIQITTINNFFAILY